MTCGECGGDVFERDPVLEVKCPVCGAPVGVHCASVAPSGHRKSRRFSGLAPWGHDERDLLAAAEGHYLHPCTVPDEEQRARQHRAAERLGRNAAPAPARQLSFLDPAGAGPGSNP